MRGEEFVDTPRRRIAMVAACPFPAPRGSQVLIRDLARALADRGHEVHVVTYPHGESLWSVQGIRLHRVDGHGLAAPRNALSWRKIGLDLGLMRVLYRVVREERIDVIHAHNYEAPLLGYAVRALTGVPVVYHSHNVLGDELAYYARGRWARRWAGRLGTLLDAQVPRRADFCIALTPEVEECLRRYGVPQHRVATVPPGVRLRAASGIEPPETPFTIVYAGNCDGYQDLDVLWEAVAVLRVARPAVEVRLVTHESEWARHVRPGLATLLAGGVARVIVAPTFLEVRRHLAQAHALVCPRSSWSGFPIKLVNYMAAGRAIVAADGSAKGVVHGETGLTFRNGSAAGLAAALQRLHDEPALRRRLGENARVAARVRYSWRRAVGQVEAIYGEVCRKQAAPPAALRPLARLQMRWASAAVNAGPRG